MHQTWTMSGPGELCGVVRSTSADQQRNAGSGSSRNRGPRRKAVRKALFNHTADKWR